MGGGDYEPEDRSSKTAKVSDLKVFTCDHCNKIVVDTMCCVQLEIPPVLLELRECEKVTG
ncbi:hypothetical protein HHI36_006418, partial [Cryptolaemus montrouzieri]